MWRRFNIHEPILTQVAREGMQLDQQLMRALEVSASNPRITKQDPGIPDSYLTLALFRLNSVLTRMLDLDVCKYDLWDDYKLALPCKPDEVRPNGVLTVVLDKARELVGTGSVIGVGHFLRAIISLTLNEQPYQFANSTIQTTFSARLLLKGLGYSQYADARKAPKLIDLLANISGREPISDHEYLITFDKDRLVFRSVSVLDPYTMKTRNDVVSRLGLLTHFSDAYTGFSPSEILELEDLINHPRIQELELQRFLEQHPKFFRIWEHRSVYAQTYLTREDEGHLIPDFVLVDPELQKSMILDLKLPSRQVIVGTKDRRRISAAVLEAKAQLLRYRDWFDDRHNRARVKEQFGMEIYRPRIGVIIGRRTEFTSEFERQQIAADNQDIELVTYDDVLDFARRRIMIIQGATRT